MNFVCRLAGLCGALVAGILVTVANTTKADELGSEVVLGSDGALGPDAPPLYDYCEASWCPLWTFQAGLVILHRSDPDDSPILGSIESIAGGDSDLGWAGGADIGIQRRLASGNSIEFRYFGGLEWDLGGAIVQPPVSLSAGYLSRFNSTELNWRRPSSDWLTWLVGFRWVELHEEINFNLAAPGVVLNQELNTDNHLYGAQLGADLGFWNQGGPFTLNGLIKAGIYGNFADAESIVAVNGVPAADVRFDGSDVAFVGELGLVGAYQLTDHWSLRGGYQLLWLDGVALAPEQLIDVPDTSGNVFYHGALMGLELAW